MSREDKRADWTVLGRKIGSGTGWDTLDDLDFIIYEFKPADGVDLPNGDLCILHEKGEFHLYDDSGEVTFSADIIGTLRDVARDA